MRRDFLSIIAIHLSRVLAFFFLKLLYLLLFFTRQLSLFLFFSFFFLFPALSTLTSSEKSLSFLPLISESARSFERSGFAFAERKLIDREKRDYVTSLSITILFFSRVLKARDKTADFVPSEKTCDENLTLSLSE